MSQVRVGLYKDNKEMRAFEFSGHGTDYLNWFTQERLIGDPYTDLSNTDPSSPRPNYFSIQGSVGWL